MKKKQKVQIFKLEERVLFDGAAAAEIAAAVDQAAEQNQNQADDHSDNSEQGKEDKLIRNTVQNAGPVDTPDPAETVQSQGEGLPQADAPRNDPAEVLINGNADFPQVTDPDAGFSGDVAEFIQSADPDAAAEHELIVIDSEAADRFDQDAFEGRNVLFLDADSDAADQIDDWMNEHSDQDISEVRLVTDSDTLASQIADIDHLEVTAVDDFQSELADADSGDLVIVPDPEASITVDAPADELPEELSNDAAEDRHELVIVNSTMADLDNVLDQLGDSREVLVIDVNADAFEQISDYLDNSGTAYDAVHILTHGNEEGFYLGHQKVIAADQMAVFSGHMADNGDFMLYGCNLASTEHGQALVNSIADYTGCDVAASVNTIGAESLGGNWNLEYQSGNIETASVSLDSSWDYRLATITVDSTAAESGNSCQTFSKALSKAAAGDTIEIKTVEDGDNGPSTFTLKKNLTIDLASNATSTSFSWNFESLTIESGYTLTVNGIALGGYGEMTIENGASVILTNGINNVQVGLESGGSLSIGSTTTVDSVTADNDSSLTFTAAGSTVTNLTLETGTTSWNFKRGTVETLNNYHSDVTASGMKITNLFNEAGGGFTLSGGRISVINHYSTSDSLSIKGSASVETLNSYTSSADENVSISGNASITTANLFGGTYAISGGTIETLNANNATLIDISGSGTSVTTMTSTSTDVTIVNGNIDTLTHNSGDLSLTGGSVSVLNNNSSDTNAIDGAVVEKLVNTGVISYVSGSLNLLANQGGTFNFEGGNVTGDVSNAAGAVMNFNQDTTTGFIDNNGEINLNNMTLSIETDSASRAFTNYNNAIVNFNDAILTNTHLDAPIGIGLSNLGGTVNATAATATISGFAFASEQINGGSEFSFNSDNNTVDVLYSITVRGTNTALPGVENMDQALKAIGEDPANFYSINIDLLISEFSKWDTYLTINGKVDGTPYSLGTLSNFLGISSKTISSGTTHIGHNVISNIDLSFDSDSLDKTVILNNVSLTVNDGYKMSVAAGTTLALNGVYPHLISVVGEGTPFVEPGQYDNNVMSLINNGTLTVEGGIAGSYSNPVGKLQSVVNNGTFNLSGSFDFMISSNSNGKEVDGIYNTGTMNISDGAFLAGTVAANTLTATLIRNIGNARISDSTVSLDSSFGGNAYSIYNDGKLEITDSFVNGSGSSSYGLFNGVNGNAVFTVTKLPDIDLTAIAGSDVISEYADQIYHIKGGSYSVFNEGIFKTENKVVSGPGYTMAHGLLTGIVQNSAGTDISFRGAPVYALIGNFMTMAAADNTVLSGLNDITLVGSFTSIGTARNDLTNLVLDGNLSNYISNIYVAGYFMPSDFKVGDGSTEYKGFYNSGITILNSYSLTEATRKGGAIYFGEKAADKVIFNASQDYTFYNLTGEMSFKYFGGLSSEMNPVRIYNQGVLTIDGTNADGKVDNLYRLYVREISDTNDRISNVHWIYTYKSDDADTAADHLRADGIADRGIVNLYANGYYSITGYSSPIKNEMTLIGLDIRNTQDASAAVTNYAGDLTIEGGKLSGTYSGLDNMEIYTQSVISPGDSEYYEFYIMVPFATLNNVMEIAGAAYSVRNDGKITIAGTDSQDTLFTNKLDFTTTYTGGYTAVLNTSITVALTEYDSSESKVKTIEHFAWASGFSSGSFRFTSASESARLADSAVYFMTPASVSERTEIEMSPTDSKSNSDDKLTEYAYGHMVAYRANADLDYVSFLAQSSPTSKIVFSNWGDLTVTNIDPDNAFNGFGFMLDIGNAYYAEPYDRYGILKYVTNILTSNTDLEVGFSVPASSIISASYPWELTMRGVKVDGSDYEYVGSFDVDGSALSVPNSGMMTLVNFSVYAHNAANAIQVDPSGVLRIHNGIYNESTHEWVGGSNAAIRSDGNANGIMLYGSMEMINGAITECVNGIVAADTADILLVVNSTIAGNSGWGIISSMSTPSSENTHNFFVGNSTIAYNGGGIKMNSGRVLLVNDVILNLNGDSPADVVGGSIATDSDGNIYGTTVEETKSYMDNVYGFRDLPATWADDGKYVIPLIEGSLAWTKSVKWSFNVSASSKFIMSEIVVGSDSGSYMIHYDKMGNQRTDPDGPIGSYVLSGTVPTSAIIVNTLEDTDEVIVISGKKYYSLRYVINYLLSDENTSPDTVVAFDWATLSSDPANLTITLDNTYGSLEVSYVPNVTPVREIVINVNAFQHEIPSGYTLTIDGSGLTNSVFSVSGIALTLNGSGKLTVTGSANTADDGAAFNLANVANTSLTLQNVTVTGGNTAGDGGAVYVGGTNAELTATGTTFSNNTAANGGAIYNNGGTITVDGTLSGNNADGSGGAIYNNGGTITVDGTLSGNNADGDGGAIYSTNGMTVSGTLSDNSAANGGAVYNASGTATISASMSDNHASANGGALYNAGTAEVTVTVTDNDAVDGAGIYNTGTLTAGALSGNIATGNGGALYNTGTATITGDISGNQAADGAGVYSINELIVNGNVNLSGNIASNNGGALYNAGTAVITGDISGNEAANGAGIYMTAGDVTLNGGLSGNTAAGEGAALYIAGGKFSTNGNVTDNIGASIIYAAGGMAQFGNLDYYYVTMSGNTGILVNEEGGDVLIVNASITENDAGAESLFAISDGVFTTLNTTINANSGDVLDQAGGTVQIGDTTIYEPDGAVSITDGYLYVLNSIVNVSNDFTVTNDEGSRINEAKSRIFVLKGGEPVSGPNGTLQIKLAGKAGRDGVMLGYTQDAVKTMLYYTSDGSTWHDAAGSVSAAAPAFEVEYSQNESERLYNGYAFLSIGAYSLKATELSLVVTISGDESQDGETTLREALEYAEYLYLTEGTVATVTFLVSDVYLTSTITIDNPVTVSGSVTIHSTDLGPSPLTFAGDSVFVVNSADPEVKFQNLTIEGQTGVRGIRVDDGSVVLKNVTIENGQADGSKGSEAKGGAIYVTGGGSVIGTNVILRSNLAGDGAAIYSNGPVELDGFTVTGNVQTGAAGGVIHVTDAASTLLLRNGLLTGNDTAGSLILTAGAAELISVSAADNGVNDTVGSSLLKAASADIVNSTIAGNTADASALVAVTDDLNAANSIIVTSRGSGQAVAAGSVKSAYSIYSGTLENVVVDVNNLTGSTFNALFSDNEGGRPMPREDSPAAVGVWTMYDPETREIAYSERPEDIWTVKYKPENMQWHILGGGLTSSNSAYLVSGSSSMPSIGANWIQGGQNHPDYGPGVNTDMINPSFTGDYGLYWDYNSLVSGYYLNPYSSLTLDSESGMGWYSSLLSDLFGIRSQQSRILSVTGGIPSDELELSVDADMEDFGEFQEAPYSAEDGTPLSQEELNAIRNAAVTGRMPDDSVHLDEAVHEKVAASLRSSELFKDRFDKALDALLGLDA